MDRFNHKNNIINPIDIDNVAWELIQSGITEIYIVQESRINTGMIYIPQDISVPSHIIKSTELITRNKPKYSKITKITTEFLHKRNELRQNDTGHPNSALDDIDVEDILDAEDIIEDL